MNTRTLAISGVSIATLIYGLTYTIAKNVMPTYVSPFGLIVIRVIGAVTIFWTLGLFIKAKPIERKDFSKIALSAFFGVALNMLTFFKGLSMTSPISASVMMLTAPICVLLISSIFLKEKLNITKVTGITGGLIGALILILSGSSKANSGENEALGNLLVLINASSYAIYLVISRQLVQKYNPIVFVKWMYLFGLFMVFPFGYTQLTEVVWSTMPINIYLNIGFVIVFTTCIAYACNLYGLSKLKPTTVSVFIYLQPVIATIYALLTKSDTLNNTKLIAMIIIFISVYMVTKKQGSSKHNTIKTKP